MTDKEGFRVLEMMDIFLDFFFFFGCVLGHAGVLIPQPGIEPRPSTVEAWSLNHWTTREVPEVMCILT